MNYTILNDRNERVGYADKLSDAWDIAEGLWAQHDRRHSVLMTAQLDTLTPVEFVPVGPGVFVGALDGLRIEVSYRGTQVRLRTPHSWGEWVWDSDKREYTYVDGDLELEDNLFIWLEGELIRTEKLWRDV